MRPTHRLLAAVKPASSARYFVPGAPTGITGLLASPSPRATLLFLYRTTLAKLAPIPETSLYRQSVEAVTKHRLAAVESIKPAGYDEWQARAATIVAAHAETGSSVIAGGGDIVTRGDKKYVVRLITPEKDSRNIEWDGKDEEWFEAKSAEERDELQEAIDKVRERLFGQQTEAEVPREVFKQAVEEELVNARKTKAAAGTWEDEPRLTIDQIEELENKIGAGLIEEVIQVAESELKLVDTMAENKVWESLEEKPTEGQWVYFERKA